MDLPPLYIALAEFKRTRPGVEIKLSFGVSCGECCCSPVQTADCDNISGKVAKILIDISLHPDIIE